MKLLRELRRRQMFRLVGLYIVGAWLVIQVADIAFPTWGIPDSAMRFLFYAALLCFPIALVFGWIFDIRSDGIYRTRKSGPEEIVDTKMRWQDYLILAGLAGIGVSILLGSAERIRVETESLPLEMTELVERHENSVAVIPFENLDPNPETGYFSDGVADEILSKLANIRSLFVPARNSSFAFRDSDENPSSIAAKLGVQYILSGTVRRDGDLVRVTARLIGEDGANVWSQSFDRRLEKTLAIQAEIAHEVANRIASEVSRPKGVEVTETVVPEAYTNYLLGKKIFHERPHLWYESAPQLFRKAIEFDPEFAPAHAYLAISLSIFGLPPERLEEVETAVAKATELDPHLAETFFAKALLVNGRDNDERAFIALLRQAINRDPTLSAAYNILGIALKEEGQFSEAQRLQEDALRRDPLNPVLIVNVAWSYLDRGDFDRGERLMLRMTQLPERPRFFHHHMKTMNWQLGRYDEYIRWSKDEVRTAVQREWKPERRDLVRQHLLNVLGSHASVYMQLGLPETGLRLMELVAKGIPDDTGRRLWQADLCRARGDFNCAANLLEELRKESDVDRFAWLGIAIAADHFMAEDYEKAIENFESTFAEGELENQLTEPKYFELAHYVVFAYRAEGRDEEADHLAHESGAILDALVEELNPGIEPVLTQIALSRWLRGDHDGAVEAFRKTVNAGWLYLYEAQQDPLWREFFRIADFSKELRAVEMEIERQRAIVEAADAEDDFDEILEAFFAKSESGS